MPISVRARLASVGDLPRLDLVLAIAVLVGGSLDVIGDTQRRGPVAVPLVLVIAMAVAALGRRREPLAFAVGVMAMALLLRTTIPNVTDLNFLPIYVLLCPPYTVAAYENKTRSAVGFAVCGCTYVTMSVIGSGRGTWYFALGMASASWAIGRAVRARRLLAAELRARTEQIASEQTDREALAVIQERTRIADELHQVIAESLSSLVVQSQGAQRLLDSDPQAADAVMAGIESTARVSLIEVRHILGALRRADSTPPRTPGPGIGQLHQVVDEARARLPALTLDVIGQPAAVPEAVDRAVHRIVSDTLASTMANHAPVRVAVCFTANSIVLEIEAPTPFARAWPTPETEERLAHVRGDLATEGLASSVTRLIATIPLVLEGATR